MITKENIDEKLRQYTIPSHMHSGIKSYLFDKHIQGDFLMSVFANDLAEAAVRADNINANCLKNYAFFMFNELPSREVPYSPWGSRENIKAFLESNINFD